jgi:hypothetical protein
LAYGQISSKSLGSHVVKPLNSSKPISITPIKHPTAHTVRITSPAKGEKVPEFLLLAQTIPPSNQDKIK